MKKQGRYHHFGVDWPGESFSESVTLCGVEGEDVGTGQTLCPDCAQVAITLNFCGLGPESLSVSQFYGVAGLLLHQDRGVMMLIGYARVSTQDQKLRLQHDALTDGGCEKLFREKLSGTSTTLPAREKLLAFARKGDVVVVWKLDRLGRSLRDLIGVVNSLQDRGVGLRSLQEAIDTTTPAARKRGVAIGRPRALTPEQILMAEAMTADPAISTRQVAEQFGIHRSTLYRHLNARQKRSA